MRASGVTAVLRYGYQTAAELGPWTLEPVSQGIGYVFRAPVLARIDPWAHRIPLELGASLGPAEWIWPGVLPEWDDDTVTVRLAGRPETVR